MIPYRKTWNVAGTVLDFSTPRIMGILNITEDSFYDGGLYQDEAGFKNKVLQMVEEGADILDLGAMSSRPGAIELPVETEIERLLQALRWMRELGIDCFISIDTYRADVLRAALDHGAHICNDISGGLLDSGLWGVLAEYKVPYILMHMAGQPQNMQNAPHYQDVTNDILQFFITRINALHGLGIYDILVDPGFGFGKTIEHNYTILQDLNAFHLTNKPILVGISRKSMIYRPLKTTPDVVLPGTSALHFAALERGADVLRVHDVAAARQVITVFEQLKTG